MTLIRIEQTRRRIRAEIDERSIADSTAARIVFVEGRHPEYYFPDHHVSLPVDSNLTESDELGHYHPVDAHIGTVGRSYVNGPLAGLIHLNRDVVDAWFEEDEQVFHFPRDPYRRVDVLQSDRRVQISLGGTVVATTDRPRLVDETGLPARWYIPFDAVDPDRLTPSPTTSYCQYKGEARWWDVTTDDGLTVSDGVWGYVEPLPEAPGLAGHVSFLAEDKRIEVTVDGVVVVVPPFDRSWVSPSVHLRSKPVHN